MLEALSLTPVFTMPDRAGILASLAPTEITLPARAASFKAVLERTAGEANTIQSSPAAFSSRELLAAGIQFSLRWEALSAQTNSAVSALPQNSRQLLVLQIAIDRLHLQSELITRTADAAANAVRRVHQMGSN